MADPAQKPSTGLSAIVPRTLGQWKALGASVAQHGIGIVSGMAIVGILSQTDSQSAMDAIKSISEGVEKIVVGVTSLISVVIVMNRTFRASPFGRLLALTRDDHVVDNVVVKDADLAEAIPSPKVTSTSP